MAEVVKFTCSGCSRVFKASPSRAKRGVCPDCEQQQPEEQPDLDQELETLLQRKTADLPRKNEGFRPRYEFLRRMALRMSWVSFAIVVASSMPFVSFVVAFAERTSAERAVLSFAWFFSMFCSGAFGWIACCLAAVVIDMANDVARLVHVGQSADS